MKRLALLNPYAAGSHALWEEGLLQHLPNAAALAGDSLEVRSWNLPGRHWKWRMHQAGMTLAERMVSDVGEGWVPDAFLVTDMMDVGQFRAALPARLRSVPVVLYFHENQLTFPDHPERLPKEWDRHYAFMNLSSALLADAVWFNSEYHRRVFLEAVPGFVKGLPSPAPFFPPTGFGPSLRWFPSESARTKPLLRRSMRLVKETRWSSGITGGSMTKDRRPFWRFCFRRVNGECDSVWLSWVNPSKRCPTPSGG